ncbi:unnamed protein product [Nezara viridula]|uniref:Uncharacterized protein n=1 Tax=Nezara viridula TaxID=85310 RepID=A0A9P0EAH1_NEZVI|nr:unnamed protein product [Nezara viridula]
MGNVFSSFALRPAQSSGLSPSPTEETGQKVPSVQETHAEEELKSSVTDEKPLEEPESNDTSYGVEATAVRTLAASTGTVAILGTTAKVKELSEPAIADIGQSLAETEINDANEITSKVLSQKDKTDIVVSTEKEEVPIEGVANTLNKSIEEQSKKCEGILENKEDLHTLEIDIGNQLREGKDEIKEEKDVGKKKEKIEDIMEGSEVKDKEVEHTDEITVKEGNIDQSLVSVHDKLETLSTPESTNAYSTNIVVGIEKEPVRIVDYQEKKDRAHEPKIVEEMSVKKEEIVSKVNHPGDSGFKKEEDFEKNVSIEKQKTELINEESPKKNSISIEELSKTTPESEQVSPEASKTEEENDISSEQLKTNSLSDMSLSENLNSEGEEAAREAAKALELREMVASLSATANSITLDTDISENINNSKDVSISNTAVSPSLHSSEKPGQVTEESSTPNDVPDEKQEVNIDKSIEIAHNMSDHSSEIEISAVSIPETSEETISTSENSQEEKEPKQDIKKDPENFVDTSKLKIIEYDIQDKENDEKEMEMQINEEKEADIDIIDKTIIQKTPVENQESENQQKCILDSKESEENAVEGEVNGSKEKEVELENNERVSDIIKLEPSETKEQIEEHEKTDLTVSLNHYTKEQIHDKEVEGEQIEKENKVMEKPEVKEDDHETIAAATIIQSSFRGYQVRKHLKEDEDEEVIKQMLGEEEENSFEEEKNLLNESLTITPEVFDKKGLVEVQENDLSTRSESIISETEEEKAKHLPESLMKIAQAEVDRICKEAENATQSLMTPPQVKDSLDIEAQEEDFPAPPDELLTSESQNEEIKEDHSSSGTTEPTMPLGSNHTEGDSSKTEDTTAPSLAESEMPKAAGQTPSLQNDDFRLESSVTENVNTEIALQRDSTEGELTMEEDSTREDDVLPPTQSYIVRKIDDEDSLSPEEEKAATVIQAGYRGFKTRKRLREESSTNSNTGTVEQEYIDNESSGFKISVKDDGESINSDSQSDDKSEKDLNDSAKKIQAGVRGYLVRKKQKVERDAAVTIQSHFRGFKTRQRLKQEST